MTLSCHITSSKVIKNNKSMALLLFVGLNLMMALIGPVLSEILIFQVEGEVGRENFMYYKLNNGGNLLLELLSTEGDADLYITSKDVLPSFYPDYYDLHSATCGSDLIYVPGNFKRPITLGVYGHPSHETTNFTLKVYQLPQMPTEEEPIFEVEFNRYDIDVFMERRNQLQLEDDNNIDVEFARQQQQSEMPKSTPDRNSNHNKREDNNNNNNNNNVRKKVRGIATKSGLWAFLEIFELLFL